jgi:hypothetical protein
MHRSGTSYLAGALQEAGLFAGDVSSKGGRNNARGNRENVELRALNNAVLRRSGGGWRTPPESLTWSEGQARRRDELIAELTAESPVWTFKDPRTLLTLPFWREAPIEIVPVGIFRHPTRVARSLLNRSPVGAAIGLELWTRYNEILLDLHREDPFPLVCFDVGADALKAQVVAVLDLLDRRLDGRVELSTEAATSFYTAELVHATDQDPRVLLDDPEEDEGALDEPLSRAETMYAELRDRSLLEE